MANRGRPGFGRERFGSSFPRGEGPGASRRDRADGYPPRAREISEQVILGRYSDPFSPQRHVATALGNLGYDIEVLHSAGEHGNSSSYAIQALNRESEQMFNLVFQSDAMPITRALMFITTDQFSQEGKHDERGSRLYSQFLEIIKKQKFFGDQKKNIDLQHQLLALYWQREEQKALQKAGEAGQEQYVKDAEFFRTMHDQQLVVSLQEERDAGINIGNRKEARHVDDLTPQQAGGLVSEEVRMNIEPRSLPRRANPKGERR